MAPRRRSLRLDDLGASSKQFEWWSRRRWANVWPLHSRALFGAWGPYRELAPHALDRICIAVDTVGRTLTLAITPNWVERDGTLIPYETKYPQHAAVVRRWARAGVVTVVQHGWTHCLPGQHHPRWIGGNRPAHREDYADRVREIAGVPVTGYVAPGAATPAGWRVWHDRDFVLDWPRAFGDLLAELMGPRPGR